MKNYISVLVGTLLMSSAVASAQDYDDIYYSASSAKKENKTVEVKKQSGTSSNQTVRNPYFSKYLGGADTVVTYNNSQVVNGRDVDEYNRRYKNDDMEAYYAEENAADYMVADSLSGSDFTYTDRIVKFHNADIINNSDDAELVELYYENRPTVNLVVGTTYGGFYDPFYWGGYYPSSYYWYRPYRYGWYDPWYDPWYGGWYGGWYDPWRYSHGLYCGWHSPWGYGYPVGGHHHHHYGYVGRPRISDGGRLTAGHSGRMPSGATGRPGYASASNRRGGVTSSSLGRVSSRATSINRGGVGVSSSRPIRQSSTVSRPGTTGSIRSSVGASATQAMTQRRSAVSSQRRSSSSDSYNSSYGSRNSYNSTTRSSSSYSSGSSYSGGRSSGGGSSSGGGRSSGGGGGRGGRR